MYWQFSRYRTGCGVWRRKEITSQRKNPRFCVQFLRTGNKQLFRKGCLLRYGIESGYMDDKYAGIRWIGKNKYLRACLDLYIVYRTTSNGHSYSPLYGSPKSWSGGDRIGALTAGSRALGLRKVFHNLAGVWSFIQILVGFGRAPRLCAAHPPLALRHLYYKKKPLSHF